MEINFHDGIFPTSHGTGPFHPAIRNGRVIWYWPNITFDNENDAYQRALLSLSDALQPAADHVKDWNVSKVE